MVSDIDFSKRRSPFTTIKGMGGKKEKELPPYRFKDPQEPGWSDDDVVNEFFLLAKKACEAWIDDANRIIRDYVYPRPLGHGKTTRSSSSIMKYQIKQINRSTSDIKIVMKSLTEAFCDLDQEFKGNLVAFKLVLSRFHDAKSPGELDAILKKIGSIGRSYRRILEQCKGLGVDFEKIMEASNLDGITIMASLKTGDLVDILTTKAKIDWSDRP